MEAAVVSAILKIVGNKLGPLLMKEYSSIVGAKEDLQELRGQVVEINNWLESVRDKDVGNDPSFSWLKKFKDIAYEVDDIVDKFQLKAEKHEATVSSGIMSKYVYTKPKSIIFQCKAASKIKAIKKKFAGIVKQRNDFSTITNSLPVGHPVPQINKTVREMPLLPNIDPASVLGRDKEKHELISKLIEVKDQQLINIVSIIGLGGSGKTTLAKLVFNDGNIIHKHFKETLWVHVSQEFDVAKLLGKLFESITGEKSDKYPSQEMSKRISENLTGKRYLLVLDDVWTKDQILWDQFMVHLKSGTLGSAILLTMCSSDVARTVRSTYQFSLPLLSLDHSWQLFQQSFDEDLESEFVEVGEEIVNKCGGVALAIKVIGGVLSGKKLIGEWQAVRDSNLLDVEDEEASVSALACLRLSYFHLPSHMKQCFTICSVFPKGYMIEKEQLIDLWIAHDMITPQAGIEYTEYIGHKYFNSLMHMSFLQDVAEDKYARVKCRMHDLVHDLALSIMGDEISRDLPNKAIGTTKSYRYFSLLQRPENPASKNIFRKTRVVYMSQWYGKRTCLKALKHAKHLRSVMVGYVDPEEADTISQFKYLKYLAMSSDNKTLPKGITDVWSLQALHLAHSYSLVELPKSIGKLKRLRTLNLSGCDRLKHIPESIGDCQMISSIDLSSCKNLTVLPESIGRNQKLRVLRLNFTKIERLPSIITSLRNLECLDLEGCSKLVELPQHISNLEKLQVLNLKDCTKLGGIPVGIGQLRRLKKLGLFIVGKGEESAGISELANVSSIGEGLIIKGISHVLAPKDAHMACLKQKTRLQRLDLQWMADDGDFSDDAEEANDAEEADDGDFSDDAEEADDADFSDDAEEADDAEEVNTELAEAILNGLEPPPGIKELQIGRYSGRQYAWWMQNQAGGGLQGPSPFPLLRALMLCDFSNLKNLHGLVELPCLELLELQQMPSLESISGGPFPSLVTLEMNGLPCLGEVWMVAERTVLDGEEGGACCITPQLGQVRVGNCLTELKITYCPKLEVKPHLPLSLQQLVLCGSAHVLQSPAGQCEGSSLSPTFNKLKKLQLRNLTGLGHGYGWELLQHMTALKSLKIIDFYGLDTELPESLWSLTSLRSLKVDYCSQILVLPEALGELRSLQKLTIEYCTSLSSLPQSMGQLTSLQLLKIGQCHALHQMPDCLGELCSLCKLEITYMRGLTCLPQSICRLTTSLQELKVYNCQSITCLPQGMEGLVSLEKLLIENCEGLTSLPQGIEGLVSLRKLQVCSCPGIKSLPEGIKGLTALKKLRIYGCPDLQRRCKRETGEDWHLISHIPNVWGLDG